MLILDDHSRRWRKATAEEEASINLLEEKAAERIEHLNKVGAERFVAELLGFVEEEGE